MIGMLSATEQMTARSEEVSVMLMRTDPFRDLAGFARAFDQATSSTALDAPMDAYRVGDVVTVELDLPGVDVDSLDIQIERGELRVQATRRSRRPEGARFLIRERTDTTVQRRVMLGDVLDVDHVDAEYTAGVLTLRIPLRETAKPRRIDVRHSDAHDATAISAEAS
jgi:HSP20 family protein